MPRTTSDVRVKRDFGFLLQTALDERSWNQSDLARAIERVTGRKIGRDAISSYINGRNFPTPATLHRLCQALGGTREELFPSLLNSATQEEAPSFEIRVTAEQPGRAYVRINRSMSFALATEIAHLLNVEDAHLKS